MTHADRFLYENAAAGMWMVPSEPVVMLGVAGFVPHLLMRAATFVGTSGVGISRGGGFVSFTEIFFAYSISAAHVPPVPYPLLLLAWPQS